MFKRVLAGLVCAAVICLTGCSKNENSTVFTSDSNTSANNSEPAESNIDGDFKGRTSMFEFLPPILKPNSEDEFICVEEGVGVKITGTTAQGKALWIPDKLYGKPVLGVNLPKAEFEEIIMPDTVQIFSVNLAKVKYMNIPRNIQYDHSTDGYDMPEFDEIALEALYFDDGISEITGVFAGETLKRVSLPDSLTTLGECAFSGCSGLTDLVIPENVKKIDPTAFEGCENIRVKYGELIFTYDERIALSLEATCDENGISHTVFEQSNWGSYEEKIYDNKITYCSRKVEKLTVPANIVIININGNIVSRQRGLNECDRLQSVEVDPENKNYYSKDGVLFRKKDNINSEMLIFYPNAKPDKSYTVPDDIIIYGSQGYTPFSNSIFLQNLEVSAKNEFYSSEDGVLYYKKENDNDNKRYLGAFPGGKTEYDLPDDVLGGTAVLANARGLKSINASKNNEKFQSKDGVLYNKNLSALIAYPLGKTDTEYTLPDSVVNNSRTFAYSGIFANPYLKTIVYKGKSYTSDENWFDLMDAMRYGDDGILISNDTLTGVSKYAEEIVIPDTVTSIDKNAFNGCDKLKSVKYKGRTYTKDELNELCELLDPERGLTITSDGKLTNVSPELTEVVIPDRVTEIARDNLNNPIAFKECDKLEKVTFGSGISSIKGDYMLMPFVFTNIFGGSYYDGCTGVEEVIVSEGVTEVGDSAFAELSKLKAITLPNSLTSIGVGAFLNCTSLNNITIPDSVTSIAITETYIREVFGEETEMYRSVGSFDGCTNIKATYKGKTYDYAHIDDLYKAINGDDYGLTITNDGVLTAVSPELTEVKIPDRVTSIAGGYNTTSAFANCDKLTKVTFGKGMHEISGVPYGGTVYSVVGSVLNECTSLNEVIVPNGVTAIRSGAFAYCESLKKITLPDGLECINGCAFEDCKSLTNLVIPDSVTEIGYREVTVSMGEYEVHNAFEGCTNIKVTYKGKIYDYAHIDDLYKAINGD